MEQACRLKEIELRARERGVTDVSDFDVSRNIRMVPPFREQEVDKFFALFERVAINLKWPKTFWPTLLQCEECEISGSLFFFVSGRVS